MRVSACCVRMSISACPHYLFSISSLILQRWDGFFFFPLRWNCLFVRVENNRDRSESEGKLWGRGSAVSECRTVLLLGQFEYVFLIGLWRPRLLFSAFPQKCLHDVTVLSWGAQEQRCSFEARRTCSLSPTKGKIDLAESQGNLWEGGGKKKKNMEVELKKKLIKTVILCCGSLSVKANKFKTERRSGNYSVSSVLATTKGTITQPELRLHGVRTPLTFRIGILKRYLKETFCLSFPFLRSPGAFYIFFFFV